MDNTNWVQAAKRLQPSLPGGAQRAGMLGMGAGNIPFAPGMAGNPAPQYPSAAQVAQPQMPGGQAPQPPSYQQSPAGSPQMPGGQGISDPRVTASFAEYLINLINGAAQREQQRRGGGRAY